MTALIVMLIATLVPTGQGEWLLDGSDNLPSTYGTPAICMFHYQSRSEDIPSLVTMLFSILVLCISCTTRAIKLFKWSSEWSRRIIRTPGNAVKKHLAKLYNGGQKTKSNKLLFSIPYHVILGIYLVVKSWMDLLDSMFWEVCQSFPTCIVY